MESLMHWYHEKCTGPEAAMSGRTVWLIGSYLVVSVNDENYVTSLCHWYNLPERETEGRKCSFLPVVWGVSIHGQYALLCLCLSWGRASPVTGLVRRSSLLDSGQELYWEWGTTTKSLQGDLKGMGLCPLLRLRRRLPWFPALSVAVSQLHDPIDRLFHC